MEIDKIQKLIQNNYDIGIRNIEIFRSLSHANNVTYTVYGLDKKYFFKAVNNLASFEMETALSSIDIQLYLMRSGIPAIPIVFTKGGLPCIRIDRQDAKHIYVMYEFIEGIHPRSMIKAGEALGQMHNVMKNYTGHLVERGKYYFIDRYVSLMWKYQYPKVDFFNEYGNELWNKAKKLPRGYCHCDLYVGNMHKAKNGKIYVIDFDTSCMGFPVYDIALFCNGTDYFKFDYKGYERTKIKFEKFLAGYQRHNAISNEEISALWIMIGIYHFQLTPQQIEHGGYHADTEDNGYMSNTLIFWERQHDWLIRWKEQCLKLNSW